MAARGGPRGRARRVTVGLAEAARPDLVVGGAGFVGSHLVRALVRAGRLVVVADNLCATHSLRLLDDLRGAFDFHHADIRCPEDLARLPRGGFRRVYHLAASFANELSVEHPTLDARTNAEGTRHVVALARERGCELLVYTGSSSSYGAAPLPMREDGPLAPQTDYARNKLVGERHVIDSGLPFACLRLFNVYGPGDSPGPYRNAVPNMMAAVAGGGDIRLLGEGATRDFSFIQDILGPLVAAERFTGEVVNLGTGRETAIADLVREILALFGAGDHRVRREPARPWDRISRRCADVSRLDARYGPRQLTPLRTGLRATAEWLHAAGLIARGPA